MDGTRKRSRFELGSTSGGDSKALQTKKRRFKRSNQRAPQKPTHDQSPAPSKVKSRDRVRSEENQHAKLSVFQRISLPISDLRFDQVDGNRKRPRLELGSTSDGDSKVCQTKKRRFKRGNQRAPQKPTHDQSPAPSKLQSRDRARSEENQQDKLSVFQRISLPVSDLRFDQVDGNRKRSSFELGSTSGGVSRVFQTKRSRSGRANPRASLNPTLYQSAAASKIQCKNRARTEQNQQAKSSQNAASSKPFNNQHSEYQGLNGTILKLYETYGFLLIDPDAPAEVRCLSLDGRFYFKLDKFQSPGSFLLISERSRVLFSIRLLTGEESKDCRTYEVSSVVLKHSRTEEEIYGTGGNFGENVSELMPDSKLNKKNNNKSFVFCTATVVTVNFDAGFCHVKPNAQLPQGIFKPDNFYLRMSHLLHLNVDLIPGDILEVCIDPKNAAMQRIENASLKELAFDGRRRNHNSIYTIAIKVNQFISNYEDTEKGLLEKLSSNLPVKAVLKLLCNQAETISRERQMRIVKAILSLMNFCMTNFGTEYNRQLIEVLVSQGFFNKGKVLSNFLSSEQRPSQSEMQFGEELPSTEFHQVEETESGDLNVSKLLIEIVRILPSCGRKIHKLIASNPDHFRIEFLMGLNEVLTKPYADRVEDLTLKEVKLVPTHDELGQMLLDERSFLNISPVVQKGPYDCVESYVETYFNLLRYDCFFNLLAGIKNYLKGDLDFRDMNVATDAVLFAISPIQNSLSQVFVVTAKLLRRNNANSANLLDSRAFMFGNLVAISPTGFFNDIIWATVYHRTAMLDQGFLTVYLEYAKEVNEKSFIEALELLIRSSGSFVIAESPTYYHSYGPVLKAIQSLDQDSLPFRVELVNGQKPRQAEMPYANTEFRRGVLFECGCSKKTTKKAAARKCKHDEPLSMQEYLDSDQSDLVEESGVLDPSQTVAIKSLLQNRLAIVQGPPGTGKTYLGVHFTNLLLNLKTRGEEEKAAIDGPILLLTYKNHALDEFSKNILRKNQRLTRKKGAFIRIGSRSKDLEMQKYLLSNFVSRKSLVEQNLLNKKNDLSVQLQEGIKRFFHCCMYLDHDVALKHFDNFQIENLLKNPTLLGDQKYAKKLKTVVERYDGLTNIGQILFRLLSDRTYKPGIEMLEEMLYYAFEQWLPSNEVTEQVAMAESNKRFEAIKRAKLYDRINEGDSSINGEDDSQHDPEAIQRLIEERFESAGIQSTRDTKDLPLIKIVDGDDEDSRNPYRVEYPKCMQNLGTVSKTIASKTDLDNWKYISDPWDLTETERLHFLQAMLVKRSAFCAEKIQGLFSEHENLSEQLKKLETSRDAEVLKQASVIAMTATGAAIRNKVLNAVKPCVIIVEEAAEINEARLIALLGPNVKQLVLIGDHQQLRPQVECYKLVKKYHFDVSMMERLINNNLPFETLATQNRMRPDISKYLRDIYPDLQDNPRVLDNPPVSCVTKNCFFWNHNFPERSGRSHSNAIEAKSIIDFVIFLWKFNEYPLKSITVLTGYQGQTAELRKLAKSNENLALASKANSENRLDIQTIDMFQGDENEIVIVSLVRNNPQRKPGFLGVLNRRCVAQSRSKTGVYFLGNAETLMGRMSEDGKKSTVLPVWKPFLEQLTEDECLGDFLTIKCQNHEEVTIQMAVGRGSFPDSPFCDKICDILMPCEIHWCEMLCQPYHAEKHFKCEKIVDFVHKCGVHMDKKECCADEELLRCKQRCTFLFHEDEVEQHPCTFICGDTHCHSECCKVIHFLCPDNGHSMYRKCFQDESLEKCERQVTFTYKHCNFHTDTKLCYEKTDDKVCRHSCLQVMEPCRHPCRERCQSEHTHRSLKDLCLQPVAFTCPRCGHRLERPCHVPEKEIKCRHRVQFIYPKCRKHEGTRFCYEDDEDKVCPEQCESKLLECVHVCQQPCNTEHGHDAKSAKCMVKVPFKHICGKILVRNCCQKESEVVCSGPCRKRLPCGHNCYQKCQPDHNHDNNSGLICCAKVLEKCAQCNNTLTRQCHQDIKDVRCQRILDVNFSKCGHPYQRRCFELEEDFQCKTVCRQPLENCEHLCASLCGEKHLHDSENCLEPVEFEHVCGKILTRKCKNSEDVVECGGNCMELLPCYHSCTKNCRPLHDHDYLCERNAYLNCKSCGKNLRKKCYKDPKDVKCDGRVYQRCTKCGVESNGPCEKSGKLFQCQLPCNSTYDKCGHRCSQKCYETCLDAKCKACLEEKKEKEKREAKAREKSQQIEIEQKRAELRKIAEEMHYGGRPKMWVYEVQPTAEESSEEYFTIKNQVMKYLTIEPGYMVKVKQVFKVHNAVAQKRLVEHQMRLIDPRNKKSMCYLTFENPKAIEGYKANGFHAKFESLKNKRGRKCNGYRERIKFCTLSQEVRFKGESSVFNVLICDVLVGRCKAYDLANQQNIPHSSDSFSQHFDSVFIPGESGLSYYYTYNPFYIDVTGHVTFTLEPQDKLLAEPGENAWKTGKFQKIKLESAREFKFGDELDSFYRMAESQFLRLARRSSKEMKIDHVDLYENPELEQKFHAKQEEFGRRLGHRASKEILVFHGTPLEDPEPIMKENFRLDKIKRTRHGYGIYFSEFPDESIEYAGRDGSLILARVLPGNQIEASKCPKMTSSLTDKCPDHDSHLVSPDGNQMYSEMVVIQDVDQILPLFNIHWSYTSAPTDEFR